jgi:co-chaperonin GroES (HSP10)
MPLKNEDILTNDKEQKLIGILKYGNKSLEALNINPGDVVGFTPNSEWEFIVDEQRVFCMKSNDIVIKYEHQGNQIEYNPSWAHRDS